MEKTKVLYIDVFGIGSTLAVVLSWDMNHSILWAIAHALFGWLYVLYWVILH